MTLLTTDGSPVEVAAGFIRFGDVLGEFVPSWVRVSEIQRLIDRYSGVVDGVVDVVLRGGEVVTVYGESPQQIMLRMVEWSASDQPSEATRRSPSPSA